MAANSGVWKLKGTAPLSVGLGMYDMRKAKDGNVYALQATGTGNLIKIDDQAGAPALTSNVIGVDEALGSILGGLPQAAHRIGGGPADEDKTYTRILSMKMYELKDHLGNVRVVFNDFKVPGGPGLTMPNLVGWYNYYNFGMRIGAMSNSEYRYGFNGKEKDSEWNSGGATYDYGFRIYDPRIAKFLSVDPLTKEYPWYTPYQFAGNKPIQFIDIDGLEEGKPTKPGNGGKTLIQRIGTDEFMEQTIPYYAGRVWNYMKGITWEGNSKQTTASITIYNNKKITVTDPKYQRADKAPTKAVDEDLLSGLGKVPSSHKYKSKSDNSSGDGRGSGKQGGTDWDKEKDITKTYYEGVQKATGVDPYKISKEVNEQNTPEYSYIEYRSVPNQDLPDTTLIIRTDNQSGKKDTSTVITP